MRYSSSRELRVRREIPKSLAALDWLPAHSDRAWMMRSRGPAAAAISWRRFSQALSLVICEEGISD